MAEARDAFQIKGDMIVSDILAEVPGALDFLIAQGFAQLADPELRQALTPQVNLRQASEAHSIPLGGLIEGLNRLARDGKQEIQQ